MKFNKLYKKLMEWVDAEVYETEPRNYDEEGGEWGEYRQRGEEDRNYRNENEDTRLNFEDALPVFIDMAKEKIAYLSDDANISDLMNHFYKWGDTEKGKNQLSGFAKSIAYSIIKEWESTFSPKTPPNTNSSRKEKGAPALPPRSLNLLAKIIQNDLRDLYTKALEIHSSQG
jgi:hypothetical protein